MKVLKQISEEALLPYQRRKPISFDIEVVSIDLTGECQGKNAVVKTVVDDVEKALLFEEGHTVLEFDFPAVEKLDFKGIGLCKWYVKVYWQPKTLAAKDDKTIRFCQPIYGHQQVAVDDLSGLWMTMPMIKIASENESSK